MWQWNGCLPFVKCHTWFEKKNKRDSEFKIIFNLPPLGLNFKVWLLSLSIWPSIEVTFISYSWLQFRWMVYWFILPSMLIKSLCFLQIVVNSLFCSKYYKPIRDTLLPRVAPIVFQLFLPWLVCSLSLEHLDFFFKMFQLILMWYFS